MPRWLLVLGAVLGSAQGECNLVGQYVVPYGGSATLSLLDDLGVQTVDEIDTAACYAWYVGRQQSSGGSDVGSFSEPGVLRAVGAGVALGDPVPLGDDDYGEGDDYSAAWASYSFASLEFSSFAADYYASVRAVPDGVDLPLYESDTPFMVIEYHPNDATPTAGFSLTVLDVTADRLQTGACQVVYLDMGAFMLQGSSSSDPVYAGDNGEPCLELVVAPYHEASKRVQWAAATIWDTSAEGVRYAADGAVVGAVGDTTAKGSLVWVAFNDSTASYHVSVDCPANGLSYTQLDFDVPAGECAYVTGTVSSALDVVNFAGAATGGVAQVLAVDGYSPGWGDVLYRGSSAEFDVSGGGYDVSSGVAELYVVAGLGGDVAVSGEITTPMDSCGATDADGCGYCLPDSETLYVSEWNANVCQAYRVLAGPTTYHVRYTLQFDGGAPSDGTYIVARESGSGEVLAKYGADYSDRASFWTLDLTEGLDVVVHGGTTDIDNNFFQAISAVDYGGACLQQLSATGEGGVEVNLADLVNLVDGCAAYGLYVTCEEGTTIQTSLDAAWASGDLVLTVYEGQSDTELASAAARDGPRTGTAQSSGQVVWVDVTSESGFYDGAVNGSISFRQSVDCALSDWEITGSCDSAACGFCDLTTRALCRAECQAGQQRQNRTILTEAANGGAECGAVTQLAACEDAACDECPHVIVIYYRSPDAAPYLTYDLGDSAVYASVPMTASGNGRYPAASGWYSIAVGGDTISFVFESSEGEILSEYYALGAGDALHEADVLAAYAPVHDHFVL